MPPQYPQQMPPQRPMMMPAPAPERSSGGGLGWLIGTAVVGALAWFGYKQDWHTKIMDWAKGLFGKKEDKTATTTDTPKPMTADELHIGLTNTPASEILPVLERYKKGHEAASNKTEVAQAEKMMAVYQNLMLTDGKYNGKPNDNKTLSSNDVSVLWTSKQLMQANGPHNDFINALKNAVISIAPASDRLSQYLLLSQNPNGTEKQGSNPNLNRLYSQEKAANNQTVKIGFTYVVSGQKMTVAEGQETPLGTPEAVNSDAPLRAPRLDFIANKLPAAQFPGVMNDYIASLQGADKARMQAVFSMMVNPRGVYNATTATDGRITEQDSKLLAAAERNDEKGFADALDKGSLRYLQVMSTAAAYDQSIKTNPFIQNVIRTATEREAKQRDETSVPAPLGVSADAAGFVPSAVPVAENRSGTKSPVMS